MKKFKHNGKPNRNWRKKMKLETGHMPLRVGGGIFFTRDALQSIFGGGIGSVNCFSFYASEDSSSEVK